jgi:hypothetical protein
MAFDDGRRQTQMTLQYRIRLKYQDQRWDHRIYLCDKLLSEAVDLWLREDAEFPTRSIVAEILYLFSPRCEPFELPTYCLRRRLAEVVGTAEWEFQTAWPNRGLAQADALIVSLATIIGVVVESWTERGSQDSTSGGLTNRIVEELLAQQYVVFHHCETTRRDINHWGI